MSAPVVPAGQTVKDKDRLGISRAQRIGKYGGVPRFVEVPISLLIADVGDPNATVDDSAVGRKFAHDQLDLMLNVLGKYRHEGGES